MAFLATFTGGPEGVYKNNFRKNYHAFRLTTSGTADDIYTAFKDVVVNLELQTASGSNKIIASDVPLLHMVEVFGVTSGQLSEVRKTVNGSNTTYEHSVKIVTSPGGSYDMQPNEEYSLTLKGLGSTANYNLYGISSLVSTNQLFFYERKTVNQADTQTVFKDMSIYQSMCMSGISEGTEFTLYNKEGLIGENSRLSYGEIIDLSNEFRPASVVSYDMAAGANDVTYQSLPNEVFYLGGGVNQLDITKSPDTSAIQFTLLTTQY